MIADWRQKAVDKSLILNGISLLLLLSGCATAPLQSNPQLAFAAAGKFGIKDDDSGYSARFSWRHYHVGYDIEVWGPLGQGRTLLSGDDALMQVRRGEEILAQGSPQQVMLANLGWSLPIAVLPAWIQGFPATQMPYEQAVLDDEGRYTSFAQAGWQVTLDRYQQRQSATQALFTPARVVARNGLRKVTVVVRDYAQ